MYILKTPQAVINSTLASFPYLLIPKHCSYHNYSMSYGTLNMMGGHLKDTNLMVILHKVRNSRLIFTITYLLVFAYHINLYEIVIDQYLLNYDLLTVAKTYFTSTKVSKKAFSNLGFFDTL